MVKKLFKKYDVTFDKKTNISSGGVEQFLFVPQIFCKRHQEFRNLKN